MTIYNDTTGLTKNPFIILDAVDYMGEDAYEEYEATAKDYNVAKVTGPNKTIMDTDYLGANEMLGLHQVFVNWYSDFVTPLSFEYWWRDNSGNENSQTITTAEVGAASTGIGHNFGNAFFNENLEYRVVIKSNNNVPKNKYVWVDFIKLMPQNPYNAVANYGYYSGTTPYIQTEIASYVEVEGDGDTSTQITVDLDSDVKANFPVAWVFTGSTTSMVAHMNGQTATSFTCRIERNSGASWSGTVYLFYKATVYKPIRDLI